MAPAPDPAGGSAGPRSLMKPGKAPFVERGAEGGVRRRSKPQMPRTHIPGETNGSRTLHRPWPLSTLFVERGAEGGVRRRFREIPVSFFKLHQGRRDEPQPAESTA